MRTIATLSTVGLLALVVIAEAGTKKRVDYRSLIACCLAFETGDSKPAPLPTPQPGNVCPNCRGTGKIGDGTVFVTCPVCKGTGKVTKESKPVAPPIQKPKAEAVPTQPIMLDCPT